MRTKRSTSGLVVAVTAAFAVAAAATVATGRVYHDMTIQASIHHPVATVGSATTSGVTSAVYHDM
jgi:hypothetical protein